MTRTAKATAVAATSGGLLAAAAVPASAGPVQDNSTGAESVVDLMSVELPAVVAPSDRPAVAAVAPKATPTIKKATFGTVGFVGVEPPAPEPEPEPVVEAAPEEAAPEAVASETSASETSAPEAVDSTVATTESTESTESTQSSGSSESQQSTSSSTSSRESTASSRTEEREAAPEPEPAPEPEAAPAPTGGVMGAAAAYTGIMYKWGGTTPAGFDCSGYTSYVFAQVGISLPRTAEAQRQVTTPVSNPQPGDLVFYGAPAYHVGIYAGNGMMYDSGKPGIPSQLRAVFSGVSSYGRVG